MKLKEIDLSLDLLRIFIRTERCSRVYRVGGLFRTPYVYFSNVRGGKGRGEGKVSREEKDISSRRVV